MRQLQETSSAEMIVEPQPQPQSQPQLQKDLFLAALTARSPSKIEENFEPSRTAKRSAALPLAIRRSLAGQSKGVIMFASAYGREGAPKIAFQAARWAAIQSAGKVLYIHASDRMPEFFMDIEAKIPITLDDFITKGDGSALPFVVLEDSGLVCAHFRGPTDYINLDYLRNLLAALRGTFEIVIVGGDDLLADGASITFLDLVDGTIAVTEAERTRAPVAQRLKRTVEDSGGTLIGAILNRRKHHIPRWIYQIFYGNER